MIAEVVQQHLEEAASVWQMRDRAVSSPSYDLGSLAELDSRVEHHLAGLRLAGQPGWEMCQDVLAFEEPGEVFAAANLALSLNDPDALEKIITIAATDWNLARGLISAIGWLPFDRVKLPLQTLIADEEPGVKAIGIAGAAVRRIDLKKMLVAGIRSNELSVKQRSLQAAGELGRTDVLGDVRSYFEEEDPLLQYNALIAARLLGAPEAADLLLGHTDRWLGWQTTSAVITAIRGSSLVDAKKRLKEFFQKNKYQRLSVVAVGALGDSKQVEWLIQLMRNEPLARIAGEAFSMITGVDLVEDDLELEPPETDTAESDEQDTGEGGLEGPETEGDEDEDLPWPDADRVQVWWKKNASRFPPGKRYLMGQPIDANGLKNAIRFGNQRQRVAASIEFAVVDPDSQLFETRMPGFLQKKSPSNSELVRIARMCSVSRGVFPR